MRWTATTLKPRERRALILGAAVAALLLGYVYGAEPLLAARGETQARIEAVRARVDRYELLLARRDRLEQETRDLEARHAALRERLLTGPTPALAAAQLQGMVKAEAGAAAVAIDRMVVERPVVSGRIAEVPVHVTLKGEIKELSALIRRIERHRLTLAIPELTIRVQDPKDPRDLVVDLVVAGYLVLPEPPPAGERQTTAPQEGSPR